MEKPTTSTSYLMIGIDHCRRYRYPWGSDASDSQESIQRKRTEPMGTGGAKCHRYPVATVLHYFNYGETP